MVMRRAWKRSAAVVAAALEDGESAQEMRREN